MKKLIFYLIALLLPLSTFEMSADDESAVIKVPLIVEHGNNYNRGLLQIPIECHYYGVMNTIVTTVYSDLGDVAVTVTNCSTGDVWYDSFDSALEPQTMLTLSGDPGVYEIMHITESGAIYEESFILYSYDN